MRDACQRIRSREQPMGRCPSRGPLQGVLGGSGRVSLHQKGRGAHFFQVISCQERPLLPSSCWLASRSWGPLSRRQQLLVGRKVVVQGPETLKRPTCLGSWDSSCAWCRGKMKLQGGLWRQLDSWLTDAPFVFSLQ